jgi:hypothetical protein
MPIPEHVTRVTGCDCGGSYNVHRTDCSIFELPEVEYLANVDEARDRHDAYMAELNARLTPWAT